ncbi:RNA exonuclease 3 [Mortierella claussenii]|nr:RNA exonuclease 3 [Mortierella claussenii]
MFASLGLFASIPCPFLPSCPREAFCIYSHVHIPSEETPSSRLSFGRSLASSNTNRADAANVPVKRKQDVQDSTRESMLAPSVISRMHSPVSAIEAAKRRRQPLNSSTPPAPSISAARSSTTGGAVLLARPHVTAKVSGCADSKSAVATSGPPVLKIDLRAHSKPQFRQAVATQYYKEFLRIYAPLSQKGSSLATAHALDQENAVHSKTNQGSYRSLAATTLQRLKKRPVANNDDDVGIDGLWLDPSLKCKEDQVLDEVWKKASGYTLSLQQLEANGYPVTIPSGVPPPLDATQICDRCQKSFARSSSAIDVDQLSCQYHERRLRTKTQNGERIKYFPCCDGAQGSQGCLQGPHVFKEDDFLCLHGRTPFVETPKDTYSNQLPHEVVAMDCEMCYTAGGFELIRISVIDKAGKPVLDELVKPKHTVLDLNSRFSGITSLEGTKYSLEQARDRLFEIINKDTIIIGQSLENDFKVLRLVHTRVIDTAVLYPHPRHQQNVRYSLQTLAKQHLRVIIQDSEDGHDSFEDAKTCLDLVRLKIQKDSLLGK